ncbi:MAG: ribokinase, partial [Clostridia bacterium]|nr:ribokinase [Clostridia bacterium]
SDEPERAWDVLHARYPRLSVLITLGSAGSIAHAVGPDGVDTVRQQAFRADAVDTTAAGDTFTGFFIGGLAEGRPLDECMRRASMASAISVTRMGAAVSIPKVEEVESRLAEL